jgi:hypothetical protein
MQDLTPARSDTGPIVKAVKTAEPERRALPLLEPAARSGCC